MEIPEAIKLIQEMKSWMPSDNKNFDKEREAIDTVIAELEKPLPTDDEIELYALENILDGVGIQSMINTKAWIAGARWMRGLIQERMEK